MRLEYDECSMMTRENVIKKRTHFGRSGQSPRERRCINIRIGHSHVGRFLESRQREARLITARGPAVLSPALLPRSSCEESADRGDLYFLRHGRGEYAVILHLGMMIAMAFALVRRTLESDSTPDS